MPLSNSYGREEKLKSRKQIDLLFAKGKSVNQFPVKLIYLEVPDEMDFPVKAGVIAPSRLFKKAVQRNRVKRLLREAYRTEKAPLIEYAQNQNRKLILFLLFVDRQIPSYALVKEKISMAIPRLIKELEKTKITAANENS
ncbi:ribonuclease P protein component [Danxiaibacter flavus]|uniref:Ribonuclease P protein component n=1 Tax=Danxiaibacter flavus TaxID=3049108 RepID=A0ABV3ZPM2_9BACT|nr:ribonuclease P protein component [Chitinophagaceae bacterium DXS]